MPGSPARASVVSIEVDGRQTYLFETDKWREMLGASRIIDATVTMAHEFFDARQDLLLVGPVSGEIRAWAPLEKRNLLLEATWKLRQWLSKRGIKHTCGYLECSATHFTDDYEPQEGDEQADLPSEDDDGDKPEPNHPDLAWVHRTLGNRVTARKGSKDHGDVRPVCSLFAPCRLHGRDFANEWTPDRHQEGEEPRRDQRGFRAGEKYRAWQDERDNFYAATFQDPVRRRIEGILGRKLQVRHDVIKFRGLAEQLEGAEQVGQDQYVALLCADGDEFSRFFTTLNWNSPRLRGRAAWQRNRDFSRALNDAVRRAFVAAVVDVTVPPRDRVAAARWAERIEADEPVALPVLPQLLGGDDLWGLARRDIALQLASHFAREFTRTINEDEEAEIVRAGLELANQIGARRETDWRSIVPTISVGIAFAKAGYPAHAMIEAAEWLLAEAKARRKGLLGGWPRAEEACLDWHWIQSSLNETVDTAREQGFSYEDGGAKWILTTRPWTLSQMEAFLAATQEFRKLPRRKREQLDSVLRRGDVLWDLAWEAWWNGLRDSERVALRDVAKLLAPSGLDLLAGDTVPAGDPRAIRPWMSRREESGRLAHVTPFMDLLALDDILKPRDPGLELDAVPETEHA